MNEKSPSTEFIEKFLDYSSTYKVGKRVVVIEPMEAYWRERTALFLAAVIMLVKEESCSAGDCCYNAVYDITKAAWHMEQDELSDLFVTPAAEQYYADCLKLSGRVIKTVLISAYTKVKAIRFDRQRIAEFEKVFELC